MPDEEQLAANQCDELFRFQVELTGHGENFLPLRSQAGQPCSYTHSSAFDWVAEVYGQNEARLTTSQRLTLVEVHGLTPALSTGAGSREVPDWPRIQAETPVAPELSRLDQGAQPRRSGNGMNGEDELH